MTNGAIDVWIIGLEVGRLGVPTLLDLLSGEERTRAARLRTSELRVRFVIAHGALRTILSRYLGVPPGAIRIEAAATGKPFVPGAPLSFNLSHSEGLALCAVSAAGQLGVDVERIRPMADADGIVKRFFAPGEARQYSETPPAERAAAFFSTWTRKEAFIKAKGDGLGCPLDSFEVQIAPAAASPWIVMRPPDGRMWHLRSFVPRPGYMAALAADWDIMSVEFCDWPAEESGGALLAPGGSSSR